MGHVIYQGELVSREKGTGYSCSTSDQCVKIYLNKNGYAGGSFRVFVKEVPSDQVMLDQVVLGEMQEKWKIISHNHFWIEVTSVDDGESRCYLHIEDKQRCGGFF